MNKTLFIQLVEKWFSAIAAKITETFNGSKGAPVNYHETMLSREYSPDLKWENTAVDGSTIAADVVAMDSPLPLKRRDSISKASGDIPKLGIKLSKGEKLISDIQVMAARGASEAQIVAKLFDDAARCAKAIKERIEMLFLQALSTGVVLVGDDDNVGVGIRADYGYLPQNKFGAAVKWGNEGYKPLSDIARVIANTDGDTITTLAMSAKAYNLIRTSDEGKALSANFRGLTIISSNALPVPTPSQFNEAFKDEYGASIMIMDRTFKVEKNGVRSNVRPFDEDNVVFLTSTEVGRLLYGTLAEETNPVAGVEYQKVDEYILLSKYSKNDPALAEFTSSQALALPVIDNVSSIYLLNTQEAVVGNTKTAPVPAKSSADVKIELFEAEYARSEVITAMKTIGVSIAANIRNETLIAKANDLTEEQQTQLKAALNQ
ncbi:MAG: major capsid protein [Bacteroidales bacterium]